MVSSQDSTRSNGYKLEKCRFRKEIGRNWLTIWDLDVQVSSDLRPRKQCIEARNRANRLLGFIARSIKSRSAEVILKLYLALVRPYLHYAVQFWSPYYRMDIILLESVQRRMTKMIEGIRNFSYERRLKLFKLHPLE